ncbi:MAG: ATP-binding protein, partial [Bacteroidota bacterium]|nr:ATP-binding protein [Bacteroidota bacterium]
VEPANVLAETVELFRHHDTVTVSLHCEASLPRVHIDREEFSRALTNILRNAVQAIEGKGTITITAQREAGDIVIRVTDTGHGIPPDALPRIFEPNFSTKTEGMGLGLAIVKKIIDDAGGVISIESEEGAGTTVTLRLPAVTAETGLA